MSSPAHSVASTNSPKLTITESGKKRQGPPNESAEIPPKQPKLPKVERFSFKGQDNKDTWTFPPELADFIKGSQNKFIPGKVLRETVEDVNPIPSNVCATKQLDPFIRDLLTEKNEKSRLSDDRFLERLQSRVGFIFGPLCKLWAQMEEERYNLLSEKPNNKNNDDQDPNESDQNDDNDSGSQHQGDDSQQESENKVLLQHMDTWCQSFEQMAILIGQAFSSCSYIRRHRILMGFFKDDKRVKSLLTEGESIFENSDDFLFGESYQDYMKESLKTQKKSREFLGILEKPSFPMSRRQNNSFNTISSRGFHQDTQPFRGSSLSRNFNRGRGRGQGQGFFQRLYRAGGRGAGSRFRGSGRRGRGS